MYHTLANDRGQHFELLVMPGRTNNEEFLGTQSKLGLAISICNAIFCRHCNQEMQGYVRVSPAKFNLELSWLPWRLASLIFSFYRKAGLVI